MNLAEVNDSNMTQARGVFFRLPLYDRPVKGCGWISYLSRKYTPYGIYGNLTCSSTYRKFLLGFPYY